MKSIILSFLLTACFSVNFLAQTTAKPAPKILSSKDSLWLTVDSSGTKIVHHPVKAGQTLYSICKFYAISIPEVYAYNPVLQNDPTLRVGQRLKIPIPNLAIKRYKNKVFDASKNTPIYYMVQPNETLYQICKRGFGMPVDTVKMRNRMKTNNIAPGQLLLIAWMGTEGVLENWRTPPKIATTSENQKHFESQAAVRKEIRSSGICFWQKDSNEKSDLYALHRMAAVGTTISVYNPMTKKSTFAKVIGRIPNGYEKNIEVILSPAAARMIGARDPKFFVKTRFFQ